GKVPCRGRSRSDNHAAVLRLHRTQPKNRRAYNAPYRNPCRALPHKGRQQGSRRTAGATGQAQAAAEGCTVTKSLWLLL
ncbi:hypothetical protein, partial [Eisenbergiella tayi]|uniref:hypothetical protein n=1 Tax=Eisenbergiella tayi TaxID=1432052 RepID=UPI001C27F9F1